MNTRILLAAFLIAAVALLGACGGGAGGGGVPTGTVIGKVTAGPGVLGRAVVSVKGTNLKATPNAEGRYEIPGVPVGDQTVQLTVDGTTLEFDVPVYEHDVTELDFMADTVADQPEPLTASIQCSGTRGVAPCEFGLVGSAQGGRPPYTYRWDLDPSGTSPIMQQSVRALCELPGPRTFQLTVVDSLGIMAIVKVTVEVESPLKLSLMASPSGAVNVGDSITFTATLEGSFPLPKGVSDLGDLNYYYNFGDGVIDGGPWLSEMTHTYEKPTTGSCAVWVHTGERQEFFLSAWVPIHVVGEPASEPTTPSDVATCEVLWGDLLTPSHVQHMDSENLVALTDEPVFTPYAAVSDGTGLDWSDWFKLVVDWGDGTQTEEVAGYTYTQPGEYDVGIQVLAGDFLVYERTQPVAVYDPLRITSVAWPSEDGTPKPDSDEASLKDGAATPLCVHKDYQADVEHAGGKAPIAYAWDMGDGTWYEEKSPQHRYDQGGRYLIVVHVVDALGKVAQQFFNVDVRERLKIEGLSWATSSRIGETNAALKARIRGGCPDVTVQYRFDGGAIESQPLDGPGLRRTVVAGREYVVEVRATDGHGEDTGWTQYTISAP